MRFITYSHAGRVQPGIAIDEAVVSLAHIGPNLLSLIQMGPQAIVEAKKVIAGNAGRIPLAQVTLLAPIPRPPKNIICVGRNYAEHAEEFARTRSEPAGPPTIFTKAPTTVNSPFGDILADPDVSAEVDWEVELAVVIGKPGRKISRAEALNYVFGYTVLNDVTARDLQHRTSQWHIGKSVDGYCPMGPWIVTRDEIADPQNLNLTSRVNGVVKQQGNTRDMLYDVGTIIENVSRVMTLEPGDIIATGTPSGVGFARKPPEYLRPGDVVESEVEKIGTMRNKVV